MIYCDYTRVSDVIDVYGTDWSEIVFNELDVSCEDLSNIILPNNPMFFQQCKDLSLEYTILPEIDYSLYDFTGVKIMYSNFTLDN